MLAQKKSTYCSTAWNGVSVVTPNSWEATVSGKNHLHFESHFTPILEIRWEKIPPKASADVVKRSVKQIESLSGKKLNSITLPTFADKLLPGFEKYCFTLNIKKTLDVLMLYCRSCSTFFLLQFFHNGIDSHHPIHCINALNCHDNTDKEVLWAIQDFQVNIPKSYQLSGYNLAAGFTKLSFLKKKVVLHICRIAPAAIRLQQQNLQEILITLAGLDTEELISATSETLLQYERYPSIGTQIIMRFRRKKPFCHAQLRYDKPNDRLLGVIMEGISPIDQQDFGSR